jgi:hypothetical protein
MFNTKTAMFAASAHKFFGSPFSMMRGSLIFQAAQLNTLVQESRSHREEGFIN